MANYAASYLFYGWENYYGDNDNNVVNNDNDVDKILSIFLKKKVSLFTGHSDEEYINKKLVKKINAQLKQNKLPISCYVADNEYGTFVLLHFKKIKSCGGTGDECAERGGCVEQADRALRT